MGRSDSSILPAMSGQLVHIRTKLVSTSLGRPPPFSSGIWCKWFLIFRRFYYLLVHIFLSRVKKWSFITFYL